MAQPQIEPQIEFKTLEDFIKGQNNYYAHFLTGNPWGESRRSKPHFKRFQTLHPEMEKELTDTVTGLINIKGHLENVNDLPLEKLFESYPFMSQLVYTDDPDVMKYSHPEVYLTS